MKKFYFLVCLGVAALAPSAFAQQDPIYAQYMFNMLAVNPAYAGSRDVLSLTALYRYQWANIPGAPKTFTFSGDMPILKEKVGVGLTLNNDRIGIENRTNVYANVAYRIRLSKGTLAFGLSGGGTFFNADYASVPTSSDGKNDNAFNSAVSTFIPNIGGGVYYNTDRFYIGVAAPQLLTQKLIAATSDQSKAIQRRHVFLMAGYVFRLSENINLKPSALVKYVEGAPMQFDVNLNCWIIEKIGVGVSYRNGSGIAALLEFQATDQFRIGYAYEYSTTRINIASPGSHEIMVRYEFGFNKTKVISPRYF